MLFKGSIVAVVTPFTDQGEVDFEAFKELVAWHVEAGTDGIVCCGTTGEAPTLSHEEKLKIFKTAVDVACGKTPIIAGTGTYNTAETVKETAAAKALGVDGCLIVVPYYNRPTPEGCFAHYAAVSKVGLPTIVYHHPGRTGVKLSAQVLAEICTLPFMVAVKEASGGLDIIKELKPLTKAAILSGDDTIALPMLNLGAVGVVSIVANLIPREWKQIVHGRDQLLYDRFAALVQAMVLETNPQCVKYALSLMGKCRPHFRLPLLEPRAATKEKIMEAVSSSIKNFIMV